MIKHQVSYSNFFGFGVVAKWQMVYVLKSAIMVRLYQVIAADAKSSSTTQFLCFDIWSRDNLSVTLLFRIIIFLAQFLFKLRY